MLRRPHQGPATVSRVHAIVRSTLPTADPKDQRLVAAVAGLLGCVAFADADYSAEEEARVREELGRMRILPAGAVAAVASVLRTDILAISTTDSHVWARELRELVDPELRGEVFDVLMDLAAVDGTISVAETDLLRRVVKALGLGEGDYLAAQARHRERLAVLKTR